MDARKLFGSRRTRALRMTTPWNEHGMILQDQPVPNQWLGYSADELNCKQLYQLNLVISETPRAPIDEQDIRRVGRTAMRAQRSGKLMLRDRKHPPGQDYFYSTW